MDEEKIKRRLQRDQDSLNKLALSQAPVAIGEAAVRLHQQGTPLSTQALVDALLASVQDLKPGDLQRLQSEEAARLLGWQLGPADG